MNRMLHIIITAAAGLALAVILITQPLTAKSLPEVDIWAASQGGSMVFQAASSRDVLSFNLRIVGPDRFLFEDRIELSGMLEWTPGAGLADGVYTWEAWLVTANPGAPMRKLSKNIPADITIEHFYHSEDTQTHVSSGMFQVEGGALSELDDHRDDKQHPNAILRVAGTILDFLMPPAQAVSFDDEVIVNRDSTGPRLSLFDPEGSGPWPLWRMEMEDSSNNLQFWYCDFALLGCAEGTEIVPMTILRDTGNVGIGTTNPQRLLHIYDDGGFQVYLSSDTSVHRLDSFSNRFAIGTPSSISQFAIMSGAPNSSMRISDAGDIGFGTAAPAYSVHTQRADNSAQIRVTDTGASNGQTMFALENNGHPRFRLRNSALNVNWDFRTAGSGTDEQFQITRIDSGGSFRPFRLFENGDLEIAGTLTQGSSRTIKEQIIEMNAETVLTRLDGLTVHEWSYRKNPDSRHIGPMAEDFYAAFKLGVSDKHIAPGDLAGVALAATKALNEKLKAENAELREQTAELRRRLERIEVMLSNRG